jgi:hypothetical protein
MEDPEPEQKRVKRIAEHIEEEIVRAQHLPLEELIRHKAFMVRLLQFLSIEEAYAVSLASRRIYEWFQNNDIWYALAQRWLTPARLAQCKVWVEQVKPKGKRINYLWLLLGEIAQQRFEDGADTLSSIWVSGEHMAWVGPSEGRVKIFLYGSRATKFEDNVPGAQDISHRPSNTQMFSRASVVEIVYYILSRLPGAFMEFGNIWRRSVYIRSKLPTN